MSPHTPIGTNQHNARDAAESASDNEWLAQIYGQVNSLHALLVQKYKYWRRSLPTQHTIYRRDEGAAIAVSNAIHIYTYV
jgi:putative sterol carrier protein